MGCKKGDNVNYFWEGFKSVFCLGENLKRLPPINQDMIPPMPKCKPPEPENQKPEDVFTVAELEDWAKRNGWKRGVVVERWKVPEEVQERGE